MASSMLPNKIRRIFAFALIMISPVGTANAEDRQELNRASTRAPSSFDPAYIATNTNGTIVADLFEALISLDPDGNFSFDGAEGYTVSDDKLTYTFKIRNDRRWSDGMPVYAQDFLASILRIADPAVADFPKITQFLDVVTNGSDVLSGKISVSELGVTAPDNQTLVFQLEKPVSFFLDLVVNAIYPIPRHVLDAKGEYWATPVNHVSNGPFLLEAVDDDEQFVELRRNQDFEGKNDSHFETVRYMYGNRARMEQLIATDKLDFVNTYESMESLDWLINTKGYKIVEQQIASTHFLLINTLDPLLSDSRIRRALFIANNSNKLVERVVGLNKGFQPTFNFAHPLSGKGWKAVVPEWAAWTAQERIHEARALLTQVGYGPDKPLELSLHHVDARLQTLIANGLTDQWSQIDVKLNTFRQPGREHFANIFSREYQLAKVHWTSTFRDPISTLFLLRKDENNNFTGWSDTEYDRMLDELFSMEDGPERRQRVISMQNIILDKLPVMPLFFENTEKIIAKPDIDLPLRDERIQSRFVSMTRQ